MSAPTASLRQDSTVIGLVSLAHGTSHFFQLLLPPLFPLLKAEFGVSYADLGIMAMAYYVVSGVFQTVAGFAVDRFGARRVLLFGIAMIALPALLMAVAPSFWVLGLCVALAGLGNSVFHPADFTILNARITPTRLGHAFSVHGVSGSLGWAAAPLTVTALGVAFGWRGAVFTAGACGLVLLGALYASRRTLATESDAGGRAADGSRPHPAATGLGPLLTTPVWLCFGYFMLLAMALTGLQSFSIPALMDFSQVTLANATLALTCYFLGSTVGTLVGGFAAGWTKRHDLVAAGGMGGGAVLFFVVAAGLVSAWWVIPLFAAAGFASGITGPSRDLIVRGATPRGATGRVYGFVYSGLDTGAALAPALLGYLLDHGRPSAVFLFIGVTLLLGVGTVIQVRHRSAAAVSAQSS
ncbi:MAG: MFS transporter [Betaproteobacteria bacterium]|nr:MFS transporter [Betaproteobacteria bacterium]